MALDPAKDCEMDIGLYLWLLLVLSFPGAVFVEWMLTPKSRDQGTNQ